MKTRFKPQKISVLILVLLLGAILLGLLVWRLSVNNAKVSVQPTPTPIASSTPTATPVSTATSTPSATPVATATPTPASTATVLPTKVSATVDSFYKAYLAKDSKKLLSDLMTAPQTNSEKEVQSLLWKGADLDGIAGGPTLFVSSVASAIVQKYDITKTELVGSNWKVTVHETVQVAEQISGRDRILEVQASDPFLINRYLNGQSTGKYSGFLD